MLREIAAVPAGLRRPLPNSRGTNHCAASWLADKGSLHAYCNKLVHNRFRYFAIETTIVPKSSDRKSGSSVGAFVGNLKRLVQREDTYYAFLSAAKTAWTTSANGDEIQLRAAAQQGHGALSTASEAPHTWHHSTRRGT